jgi:hypothetical protein
MSSAAIARRFWNSLTVAIPASSVWSDAERPRTDYSFWWRLWASFTGIRLPILTDASAEGRSTAPAPERRRPVRPALVAEERGAGWFTLPRIPVLAGISAGDERSVVAEIVIPGDQVTLIVRQTPLASTRYSVEIVLREVGERPSIVTIRYGTLTGQRLLYIPVAVDVSGLAASSAEIRGFDPVQEWQASQAVTADQMAGWDEDSVTASIRVAANQATRDAWRQVGGIVGGEIQRIIRRALP